jgi:sigma-B regulation protein RsbU (phosphoserine phosphatase)
MFFEGDPQAVLSEIDSLMRSMSTFTDPQQMVTEYGKRIRMLMGNDGTVSLSRRGLEAPWYRITRSWAFQDSIDPWRQKDRLPLLDKGILGQMLYADSPQIINDFRADPADPAYEHLAPFRSLMFMPQYDNGVATNMVVSGRRDPNAFKPDQMPVLLWMSNLFGRGVQALVMAKQLKEAYARIDDELRVVAEIQRSLLPGQLPGVKNLRLAAHYQTSQQAGGDYYDLFPLGDGRLGILIADVSGHGTPAAVHMAITHTVAHAPPAYPDTPAAPARMLEHLNAKLVESFARTGSGSATGAGGGGGGGFVTAFYAVFDPATRRLRFSSAGHNPPRVRSGSRVQPVDGARDLPLGIMDGITYEESSLDLSPGDLLLLYTDGITEARGPGGPPTPLFGEHRLDDTLASGSDDPDAAIRRVVDGVEAFTGGSPPTDDRTLVAARVD